MILTDELANCPYPPLKHQRQAVQHHLKHAYSANFSEMGTGKSKIIIDTACSLFVRNQIDRVIVVCPASIRLVWYDPELGQLNEHLWKEIPVLVSEYHAKIRQWTRGPEIDNSQRLRWIVTNYDFIRSGPLLTTMSERTFELYQYCNAKTLLVLDESSAIKNIAAKQTKACFALRKKCGRVIILNGTPMSERPEDLFSQGNLLSPDILHCPTKTQFRARYAVTELMRGQGGRIFQSVKAWKNLDDLQRRFAPYVIRSMKKDCLDLPEKLPTIPLQVQLKDSWPAYKQMKDEALTWLESCVSMSPQVVTQLLRLSQITSGFLGGMEDRGEEDLDLALLPFDEAPQERSEMALGREKLDYVLDWVQERLEEDPQLKLLIWSRHRFEIMRTAAELRATLKIPVGMLLGGQKEVERHDAICLLDPRTAPDGPAIVIGHPASGGKGLTLTAAHTVLYMSCGYSLEQRLQSEDRVHRPGQRNVVSYFDLLALGPRGQQTIDHVIMGALMQKEQLEVMTTKAWADRLR